MKYLLGSAAVLLGVALPAVAQQPPKPFVTGLRTPESVVVGFGGKIYVTEIGEFDKDGDGAVVLIQDGKAVPFATGLDDPKGMVAYREWLFVADKTRVWKVDAKGNKTVFAAAEAFPTKPLFLNDIALDAETGTLFVSDSGDLAGKYGAIYRIDPKGKVTTVLDQKMFPAMHTPNGLATDGTNAGLIYADFGTGNLYRVNLTSHEVETLADGFGGADGVTWDHHGRLFVSDWKNGNLYVIPRPGQKPVLVAAGFEQAADTCLDPTGRFILVPDMKAGTLTAVPAQVPGAEVDFSPLDVKIVPAFTDLQWTDWKSETDSGKPIPLRPLVLTHAGDGSDRVFVATEHGVVHVFANDPKAAKTAVFLDIQDRVSYDDKQNEEGFLGLVFHPKYKENGEFFVFYTVKTPKLTNVVSRFKVSKTDPNKADPASEERLLTITKPYWNHDGGTLVFGPDGYLYVTHGDGGFFNDPHGNGQSLGTFLGKILRIDVDHKDEGKNYAVPKDNPFVGKEGAKPEIWAYGLRNIWRMNFDKKTGQLWAADVGQNLYEEINLITRGGNYGWSRREGVHPFFPKGVGPQKDLIEPIWEYNHDVGKSITGGHVYRGSKVPALDGMYLYADYVTNKLWALKYDEKQGRVVANRSIAGPGLPIYSYGEDEKGEVYWMTASPTGRGIYTFAK